MVGTPMTGAETGTAKGLPTGAVKGPEPAGPGPLAELILSCFYAVRTPASSSSSRS
jgi:hypothetical protein